MPGADDTWRRRLWGDFSWRRLLRSVLFIYVSFAVLIWFAADHLMFYPALTRGEHPADGFYLESEDGARIGALYRPVTGATWTVLYSHGNAESLQQSAAFFDRLNALGLSVFGYEYRGYGTSDGSPSEGALYADIDAAYRHLTTTQGIPASRIIVYGRSIGGGPATELARRYPVAGLVLESTFVTAFRVRTVVPILPFDRFNNLAKIGAVGCPLWVMHSRDDAVVPFWHGEYLFAAAAEPKINWWVDGAGHGGVPYIDPPVFAARWQQFTALLGGAQAPAAPAGR